VGSGLMLFPLGLAVSAFCHEVLAWPVQYAGFAAIAVLFFANFLAARAFVFRSTGVAGPEFARFMGIAVVMRAIEYLLFLALLRLGHFAYMFAMVGALVTSSASKFFIYRRWVFTPVAAAAHANLGNLHRE
jgi:putative flippase GtrA